MKIKTLTEDEERQWQEWVAERPAAVKEMCRRWRPDVLYRLKTTGQRVVIYSFSEDGTCTVMVLRHYNPERPTLIERQVFGIDPNDLEECDLPVMPERN